MPRLIHDAHGLKDADHRGLGADEDVLGLDHVLLGDEEVVSLGGGDDDGELVEVGLLAGEVSTVTTTRELRRRGARLRVPGFAPSDGFGGESVFAAELRDFFEVFDELLFCVVVVGGVRSPRRVGCKMTLLFTIDEYDAAPDAFSKKGRGKVILHPHGSRSANDIEPRAFNGNRAGVFRGVVEGAVFAVPDIGEKGDEPLIVRTKKSSKLANRASEWRHGN